jgi:hypothetical protein
MESLELLIIAFGVSTLAGMNLYLTVFLIGLSVRLQWIELDPELQALQLLSHPAILLTSGILLVIEFFADKIPWVDSLWDTIHTIVRPLGATFLALGALGELHPTVAVIAALFCGGLAMLTHLTKSGARLFLNTSPEPVSNTVVSVLEDLVVAGGLILLHLLPWVAGLLLLLVVVLFFRFGPPLLRRIWIRGRMLHSKLIAARSDPIDPDLLPTSLPEPAEDLLAKAYPEPYRLLWVVPVLTGPGEKIPAYHHAYLVALRPEAAPPGQKVEIAMVVPRKGKVWLEKAFALKMTPRSRIFYDELIFQRRDETAPPLAVRIYKHQEAYFDALSAWWEKTPR